MLLEKLKGIADRFDEVGRLITEPDVINDMKRYVQLNKEYKELNKVVEFYHEYKNVLDNMESTRKILDTEKDEEMREMAKEEMDTLITRRDEMEEEIKVLLLPADPEDAKNAIVEIRAGTGGDEASIFAGDLFRMYVKFFDIKGWKYSINSCTDGTNGGYKEV